METVYSALMLRALGKDITESAIEKIIKAAGGTADKNQIKTLVNALSEIDIDEVLAGATIVPAAAAGATAAASAQEEAPAKKKEKEKKEKKEEKEEEVEVTGLDALFG
ncbi:MAG: 50S ribosomal protein L12 [Promethearchaeota archaeon]